MLKPHRRTAPIVRQMADLIQEQNADLESDGQWWESRVYVVQEWLRSNPLRIGVPDDGTIETITQQIARGDKHTHVRSKAWAHIVSELHGIPGVCEKFTATAAPAQDECSNNQPKETQDFTQDIEDTLHDSTPHDEQINTDLPPASPLRGKIRAGKVKAPVVVALEQPTSPPIEVPEVVAPPFLEKKSLSQMSMMERQQEWLRKKAEKAAAEKLRQQEEAEKELTFQPTLRKSTRPITTPPVAQQLSQTPTELAATNKKSRTKSAPRTRKPPILKATSSLLDAVKSDLNLSAKSIVNEAPTTGSTSSEEKAVYIEQTSADVASYAQVLQSIGMLEPSTKEAPIPVKEETFHLQSNNVDSKARYQVQDPVLFDLTSIYRKKDKYARRDGVSLQMGRREDTKDEQLIAIFFDKEMFQTEDDAREWYQEHRNRLLSYT